MSAFDFEGLSAGESWGPRAVFGLVPLGDGQVYWFGTKPAPAGENEPPGRRKEAVLERFAAWHEPICAVVEATDEAAILRHDIVDREPRRGWSQGRVTLLGDAAHPMTPHLGQGACQAIEDAIVLSDCLCQGADIPAALRAYEERRFERTASLVKASRRVGRIAQLKNPAGRRLRDVALKHVPARTRLRQLEEIVGFRA